MKINNYRLTSEEEETLMKILNLGLENYCLIPRIFLGWDLKMSEDLIYYLKQLFAKFNMSIEEVF